MSLFSSPTPFADALASSKVKTLLPTERNTVQMQELAPELRERARLSAMVTDIETLDALNTQAERLIQGETDFATAQLELRDFIRSSGYFPAPDEIGTIKDLTSDQRSMLMLKTNVQMAQGYGYWAEGQRPEVIQGWPAQELYRAEARRVPRDWKVRWANAAGEVGDEVAASVARRTGRFIARKDSPIWTHLGPFQVPYPPFDFNSGMDVRDISREEAIQLGVITPGDAIKPQSRGFNEDLQASPQIRSAALRQALTSSGFRFENGVLKAA